MVMFTSGELYGKEVNIDMRIEQEKFNFGEEIELTFQFSNRNENTIEMNYPWPGMPSSKSRLKVYKNQEKVIPPVRQRMSSSWEIELKNELTFTYDLLRELFPRFLRAGDYKVVFEYNGEKRDEVSFRVKEPSEKIKIKHEKWIEADREANDTKAVKMGMEFFKKYKYEKDPISRRMAQVYVADLLAINKDQRALDFLQSELTAKKTRWLEMKEAELMKKLGQQKEAIQKMAQIDFAKATDWYEEKVENARYAYELEDAIELGRELRGYSRDNGRLISVMAQAYYKKGAVKKAIEIMDKVVPSEAQRWREKHNIPKR
jgi:tetratricopeptide (TPR) repeat protein